PTSLIALGAAWRGLGPIPDHVGSGDPWSMLVVVSWRGRSGFSGWTLGVVRLGRSSAWSVGHRPGPGLPHASSSSPTSARSTLLRRVSEGGMTPQWVRPPGARWGIPSASSGREPEQVLATADANGLSAVRDNVP